MHVRLYVYVYIHALTYIGGRAAREDEVVGEGVALGPEQAGDFQGLLFCGIGRLCETICIYIEVLRSVVLWMGVYMCMLCLCVCCTAVGRLSTSYTCIHIHIKPTCIAPKLCPKRIRGLSGSFT